MAAATHYALLCAQSLSELMFLNLVHCWLVQVHHPKTVVMATGIRSREDALALAGCDVLVLPPKVCTNIAGRQCSLRHTVVLVQCAVSN